MLADHTASEGERKIFRKRGRGSAPGKPEGFQSFLGPQGEKTSKKNKGAGPSLLGFPVRQTRRNKVAELWESSRALLQEGVLGEGPEGLTKVRKHELERR